MFPVNLPLIKKKNSTKISTVLHLGFFNRSNVGDDMFIDTFKLLYTFSEVPVDVHFVCIDDVKKWSLEEFLCYNYICVGGGDIINDYFFDTLIHIRRMLATASCDIPIACVGAGIPYPDFVRGNKIFAIDKIAMRNRTGIREMQQILGSSNAMFTPDFGFMFDYDGRLYTFDGQPRKLNTPWTRFMTGADLSKMSTSLAKDTTLRIGLSVAQPVNWIVPDFARVIVSLLDNLCSLEFLENSLFSRVEVLLIPFNTSPYELESDLILNKIILDTSKYHMNITAMHPDECKNVESYIRAIESVDLMICHRFHSHIFAICAGRPLISLDFSRKVQLFNSENCFPKWASTGATIDKTSEPKKIILDVDELLVTIKSLFEGGECEKMKSLQKWVTSTRVKCESFFTPAIKKKITNFLFDSNVSQQQSKTRKIACFGMGKERWDMIAEEMFQLNRKGKRIDFIAEVLCFYASGGIPGSKYTYGTIDNITSLFKTTQPSEKIIAGLSAMIEFIEKEENRNAKRDEFAKVNSTYIRQDTMKGLHRSGWSYCISGIESLISSPSGVLIDMYLDRTFGWAVASLQYSNVVPYVSPWCGFLHHTPEKKFGNRSLVAIIDEPLFRSSLASCVGLFCMSEYLADWVRGRMCELRDNENVLGADPSKVYVVMHPTEFVDLKFDASSFVKEEEAAVSAPIGGGGENKKIKIVNVGAWYRNPVSIYRLAHIIDSSRFECSRLVGRGMGNYVPSKDDIITKRCLSGRNMNGESQFMSDLNNLIYQNIVTNDISDISFREPRNLLESCPSQFSFSVMEVVGEPEITNPFVNSLRRSIREFMEPVKLLSFLPDKEYDILFSSSVIFIDFIDASAANTVIECCVRHTPLLTNRIPAVVEYLGDEYPLFYNKLTDITPEFLTRERILAAHVFLKDRDIKDLKIETFVANIAKSLNESLIASF